MRRRSASSRERSEKPRTRKKRGHGGDGRNSAPVKKSPNTKPTIRKKKPH